MTEDEAVERLAACKDIADLLDKKPATQLTYAQLDDLDRLKEVFDARFQENPEIRERAGITTHQVDVLFSNLHSTEQLRKIKDFNGDKE